MLNKKSIALAQTVVSNENAFLFPRQGSLLFSPVAESLPVLQSHKPSLESYGDVLYQNAQREVGMAEPHEGAVALATETIGAALLRQVTYVRKTVVPFIGDVTARILSDMKDVEPKEFTIVQYDPSALVYSPYVNELFKEMKPNAPLFNRIKRGPEKSDVEIINGMKTGVSELDNALADAIATYGSETIVTLYDVLFRNKTVEPVCPVTRFLSRLVEQRDGQLYQGVYTDTSLVDLGILAYFLIDSFSDDPLPGTGLSLVEWSTAINAMKLQYGWLNQTALNWVSDASRRGMMVVRYSGKTEAITDPADAVITVFGPVYRQALSQGVSPESVIGGIIDSQSRQRLLSQFVANKDMNYKRWQIMEQKRASYATATFLKRLSACFVRVTKDALAGLPDDAFPQDYSREAAAASLLKDVATGDAFYRNWNIASDPNLFELVKQKVCQHVFTFVDCEDIIDIVENEMRDSEVSGTEAAYTAALRYLAKWMVANFDLCDFATAEKEGILAEADNAPVGNYGL